MPLRAIRLLCAVACAGCSHEAAHREVMLPDKTVETEPSPTPSTNRLQYLYSPGCPDCDIVSQKVLPAIRIHHQDIEMINVELESSTSQIAAIERESGTILKVLAPVMVYNGRVYQGASVIVSAHEAGEL